MFLKKDNLTYFSIKNLFFSVTYWFNNFQERLKQSQVTKSPCFIEKLFSLCLLCNTYKNVRRFILKELIERVLPCFFKEFMFNSQ